MKLSLFQIIFVGAFVFFILLGVIAFSLFTAHSNSVGTVTIWGTVNQGTMTQVLQTLNQQDRDFQDVTYKQLPADTYEQTVINAMASGSGPDIIMLSQDMIGEFSNKVDTIPYRVVSQSSYVSSYLTEAELFLNSQGTIAMPFLIDPMVMYWNRDAFTTAGLAQPPQYWNDLLTQAQQLTRLDASKNIKQSAIAMGSWDNISYAKDILAGLFIQAGDGIIQPGSSGPAVVFSQTPQGAVENPASSALQFYTEFANPSKVTYSWNRSLPNSGDDFAAGNLAIYIGFASDYGTISARNPNLHFSVALLPQIQGNSTHATFGQLTGLAIPRTAGNSSGALTIVKKLSSQMGIGVASSLFALPPVRSDVATNAASSVASDVFYQSALIARGWLDPNPTQTNSIFKTMVDSVVSNQSLPDAAVSDAAQSLTALVPTSVPAQ